MTIALVTATTNTAIYKSIEGYIRSSSDLGSYLGEVVVEPAQAEGGSAATRRVEMNADENEPNRRAIANDKLIFWLEKMIRKIAYEIDDEEIQDIGKGISILVILAGQSDIEQGVAAWEISPRYKRAK